jgi:drug/metabolite transporter (DMT)-like permease
MKDVTASTASILGYLEPVCVIILGMIFLNEAVGIATFAGGLMILLSGYLTLKL